MWKYQQLAPARWRWRRAAWEGVQRGSGTPAAGHNSKFSALKSSRKQGATLQYAVGRQEPSRRAASQRCRQHRRGKWGPWPPACPPECRCQASASRSGGLLGSRNPSYPCVQFVVLDREAAQGAPQDAWVPPPAPNGRFSLLRPWRRGARPPPAPSPAAAADTPLAEIPILRLPGEPPFINPLCAQPSGGVPLGDYGDGEQLLQLYGMTAGDAEEGRGTWLPQPSGQPCHEDDSGSIYSGISICSEEVEAAAGEGGACAGAVDRFAGKQPGELGHIYSSSSSGSSSSSALLNLMMQQGEPAPEACGHAPAALAAESGCTHNPLLQQQQQAEQQQQQQQQQEAALLR